MPAEYHFLGERREKGLVQIDHHFSDPLLSWGDAPIICGESKLSLNRRLHTGAIENLSFNLGCRQSLGPQRLKPGIRLPALTTRLKAVPFQSWDTVV